MNALAINNKTLLLFLSMPLLLWGCGGGSSGGAEDAPEQAGVALTNATPFAYVQRSISNTAQKTQASFANRFSDNKQSPLEVVSPYEYSPGARLYLRSGMDADATQEDILSAYFGSDNYDVKDLNISPDGKRMVFAARGDDSHPTDSSWNIFVFDFSSKQLRRVIADDAIANGGQDTNPTITWNGGIIFSSDRDAGNPDKPRENIELVGGLCRKVDPLENPSLLHAMDMDGSNIKQLTYGRYNHDIQTSTLKDGRVAFVRWERSYQPMSSCATGAKGTDLFAPGVYPQGLASPESWDRNTVCQYSKSTDGGMVAVSSRYKLLTISEDGESLQQLYKTVTPLSSDEAFLTVDEIFQAENGNLFSLLKHEYNPVSGGALLELQPTHNSGQDTIFTQMSARALTAEEVNLYPGQLSNSGWFSAFWPYRDGTSRLMVSWANCTLVENGVSAFCNQNASEGDLNVQYGIWVFDPNSDTRSPLVAARNDTVFTELAIAQPHRSADMGLTPFDPDFVDNEDATQIQCEFDNKAPVAMAGPDRSGYLGETFVFDGSASTDPDGDPLSYYWSLQSTPANSNAALADAAQVNPRLTPDQIGVYQIQLVVSDGELESSPDSLTLTVLPPNNAPVADAGPDQTLLLGATATLDGSNSSDADGDAISYSWMVIARPDGSTATLSGAGAAPRLTPDLAGNYTVELIVNDGVYDSAPDTVTITANMPPHNNRAPVANAGADRSAATNTTVTLDGSGSRDPDGDPLSYRWVLSAQPDGGNAMLANANSVNPSFSGAVAGIYTASLVVNDGELDSASDSVNITLSTAQKPPVANAGADQSGVPGQQFTLDGSASRDPEGEPLSYRWTLLASPDGSAAALAGADTVNPRITADLEGGYTVQLIVNDGELDSNPDTVNLTVATPNNRPVANAGPDQHFRVDQTLALDGSGSSDLDGDSLTYAWRIISPPNPASQLSDPTAVAPTITLTGTETYVVELIVHDGRAASAADTVTLSFNNTKPLADAGADQTGMVGDDISLDGSGSSDVDGDTLTYRWNIASKPAASAATLSDATAVNPGITLDAAGTFMLQLVVNDGYEDSTPDTVIVTAEQNTAPVANAGADRGVEIGSLATLDGSASSDADGDPLSYRWDLLHKPAASSAELSDINNVTPTLNIDAYGEYVVQLIVNDGSVDSQPDTVRLTSENLRPVADAGADQGVEAGTRVALDGSASYDPEGSDLTYQWSLIHTPEGSNALLENDDAVTPALEVDIEGTYIVQLMVNDGLLDSYPDTVSIAVTAKPDVCEVSHETKRTLPVTIRDFKRSHPDFEYRTGVDYGIVRSTLGSDGLPVYRKNSGSTPTTTGKKNFNQWYRDVPGVNINIPKTLTISRQADSTLWEYSSNNFFPIDGEGWGNTGLTNPDHNYHFTLEAHLVFDYKGGEVFKFIGDDDLWLFINGKLVIDIGGVHLAIEKSVNIDDVADSLGLVKGNRYSFDLFFAERHTVKSDFTFQTNMDLECVDPE